MRSEFAFVNWGEFKLLIRRGYTYKLALLLLFYKGGRKMAFHELAPGDEEFPENVQYAMKAIWCRPWDTGINVAIAVSKQKKAIMAFLCLTKV